MVTWPSINARNNGRSTATRQAASRQDQQILASTGPGDWQPVISNQFTSAKKTSSGTGPEHQLRFWSAQHNPVAS